MSSAATAGKASAAAAAMNVARTLVENVMM
jgi:hypothetical protein